MNLDLNSKEEGGKRIWKWKLALRAILRDDDL